MFEMRTVEGTIYLCILLLFLFLFSIEDIKTGKISLRYVLAGMLLAGIYFMTLIIRQERSPRDIIWALIPGSACLMIAWFSQGMGSGDGLLIILTGLFFPFRENLILILLALFLCSFVAGVLLVMKKMGRKSRLPFVPFIFIASFIVGIWHEYIP